MKSPWEERFFAKNREFEVELAEATIDTVLRALAISHWRLDDSFWAPDLQVSRYTKESREVFVVQETYFAPKLTGEQPDIEEIRVAASKIDPGEEHFAGKSE